MKFKKLKIFGKHKDQRIERHSLFFELKDACETNYCPVCFLLNRKERQHIESVFYEHVNDPVIRKKLRKSQGLCQNHVRLFLKYGDALGLTILAQDLVVNLIENQSLKMKPSACPFCLSNEMREERLAQAVVEYLDLNEFWQALEKSVGLCLRHFRLIERLSQKKEAKLKLLNFQKKKFAQQEKLLVSFIRNNNFAVSHDEITDAEAQCYQLVWKLLSQ